MAGGRVRTLIWAGRTPPRIRGGGGGASQDVSLLGGSCAFTLAARRTAPGNTA